MISVSRSRRGQTAIDVVVVIVVLLVLAIVVVSVGNFLSGMNDEIQADDSITPAAQSALSNVNLQFVSTWDNVFMMALVIMWVFLLVTAFLIDTHPVFFVITLFLLVFIFVAAMIVSNSYDDFVSNDAEISAYASQFPKMDWIMNHLLGVVIVMGFSAGLVLYAKSQS